MATTLLMIPSFFVMQASPRGPYLCLVKDPPVDRPSGFLNFAEPQIWSPLVKFAAEISATGDRELVHIRSCYNNKYLVLNNSVVISADHTTPTIPEPMFVASADKPEEDQTNPACTLFRVSSSSTSSSGFQLFCTSSSKYVSNAGGFLGGGLFPSQVGQSFITVDWETLVRLPSQVSFRSEDLHGNYMCSRVIDKCYNYHRFESGLDVGNPLVAHELFPTPDGNYRIKNLHFGKFLRRSPTNWIRAEAEDNDNSNDDTLFSFVKISDNVFALRSLGNNNFCGAITKEGKDNCLTAEYPSIASRQTRLIVEERVVSRKISDVVYRFSDSRIYEDKIQEVSHAFATNESTNQDHTVTLSYSSSDSMTTYWRNSLSVKFGAYLEFKTTAIPFILKGEVSSTTDVSYTREWGEQKTTERTSEATYTAVVPPLTKIKVTLLCTKGACDVPFTYRQRDLLPNGQMVTTIKDDGIYTGINSYKFHFQSSEVVEDAQGRMYL